MRDARWRVFGGLVAFLLLTGHSGGSFAAETSGRLLDRLAAIEEGCQPGCGPVASPDRLRLRFAELTADLGGVAGITDGGTKGVAALNDFVFGSLGIEATQDLKDPANLLLSSVLERKQGYCVGIAALYLVLSEQLNLPIHAVETPSHVFLRYEDGAMRINIETFQRGAHVPDEQYVQEQRISHESIGKGVFMRGLTDDEFLAQVYNNLGVIYSERKEYERAAAEYVRAVDLHSRFPAAYYNHGNDLLQQGEYRRAVRLFSKSLRLHGTDVWALNNRGLAHVKLGRRGRARRDFEEALKIDPGFEAARKNLGLLADCGGGEATGRPRRTPGKTPDPRCCR